MDLEMFYKPEHGIMGFVLRPTEYVPNRVSFSICRCQVERVSAGSAGAREVTIPVGGTP